MLNESHVEEAALEWLKELGWGIEHGPHIAPQEPKAERDSFSEVVLNGRLQDAIRRLNPDIPTEALEDAFKKVVRPVAGSAVSNNRRFHTLLREGVEVEWGEWGGEWGGWGVGV